VPFPVSPSVVDKLLYDIFDRTVVDHLLPGAFSRDFEIRRWRTTSDYHLSVDRPLSTRGYSIGTIPSYDHYRSDPRGRG
jgi:hypothetical protein